MEHGSCHAVQHPLQVPVPVPDPDFNPSRIPDLGVKKAPDPGSRGKKSTGFHNTAFSYGALPRYLNGNPLATKCTYKKEVGRNRDCELPQLVIYFFIAATKRWILKRVRQDTEFA